MRDVQEAIEEFGRSVGLPGLLPGPDGAVRLQLDGGEAVGLEIDNHALVVSHVFPAPFLSRRQMLSALQTVDGRYTTARGLQLGLLGRGADTCLVVACRLPQAEATAQRIGHTLVTLRDWFRRWAGENR